MSKLQEQYEKETGQKATDEHFSTAGWDREVIVFEDDYVQWLEARLEALECPREKCAYFHGLVCYRDTCIRAKHFDHYTPREKSK